MAQVQQPHQDQQPHAKYNFVHHVTSLPLVHDTLDQAKRIPMAKGAGKLVSNVSKTALAYAKPIEPYLERADHYADQQLSNLEQKYPLVKAPTQEIRDKTSGAAKTTVDTYVGAVTDKFSGVNGHHLKQQAKEGKDAAIPALNARVDAVCKPVLDLVEDLLDTYLPKQKRQAKEAAEKTEGKVSEAQEQAKSTVLRVYDLSTSLMDRSLNKAKQTAHAAGHTVHTAADYARWSVQHPTQVPGAAYETASARVHDLRERVDGTLDVTRSRVHHVSELVQQAKQETVRVYQDTQKHAPEGQPKRLVWTTISTSLTLMNEAISYAAQVIKEQADEARKQSDVLDKAAKKTEHAADKAGEHVDTAKDKAKEVGEQAHEQVGKPAKKQGHKAKEHAEEQVSQSADQVKHAADQAKQ
ncbi:hypothetical protein BCR37DRAFT_116943 [Protomyces lactucae-debilis]|uniref:Uncharacterized protein n=1 Tax=Protomyces lactucae-debilis TaxID=2754530 RepID=A0A1Y2F2Z4_PROLT|nr:uncharacterized protein BCR37DRAFT_116943 [Protomyces lactucae-debilis]ORY78232.1 hypothetical protein BCR37DRAFT_116943 [Protomyces lactucae-debilis]